MINEVMTLGIAAYVIVMSVLVAIYGAICWGIVRKAWKEGK